MTADIAAAAIELLANLCIDCRAGRARFALLASRGHWVSAGLNVPA
jgi:hypothetical protein